MSNNSNSHSEYSPDLANKSEQFNSGSSLQDKVLSIFKRNETDLLQHTSNNSTNNKQVIGKILLESDSRGVTEKTVNHVSYESSKISLKK